MHGFVINNNNLIYCHTLLALITHWKGVIVTIDGCFVDYLLMWLSNCNLKDIIFARFVERREKRIKVAVMVGK